jgi:hypothetical protein
MAQQQSLFGPSIYDVQQQQMQQDRENAIAQARLTPYQSIRAGMGMAGTQAGRSIAGLFGVEDPKLKEASARQELKNAISAQWDGQDPAEAYKIMAREATRLGLTQEAIAAAAQVKAAEESKTMGELKRGLLEAQTGQAVARGKQAEALAEKARKEKLDTPFGKVDPDKFTPESLDKFRETGNYADLVAKPDKAKAPPSVGSDREAVSLELYNKNFMELTQPERVAVNKRVEEATKSRQTTNVVLNTPQTAALVDQGQKATKPIFDRVQSIDRSISLIDQNTPFSEAALRQEIASIFGDSQKAATEIRGLANTGSLDERIANRIVDFVSGKPTKVTNEDRRAVLVALRKREQDQYERRLNPFRQAIKKESGGDPNAIFPSFEEAFGVTPGTATGKRKTKSGTEYTVE